MEKSTAARSSGDIIIQEDRRLPQAECVGGFVCMCVFCVLTFIPLCEELRKREGRGVRH